MKLWLEMGKLRREYTNTAKTINPFVPNASFLYPLKTSENLKGL